MRRLPSIAGLLPLWLLLGCQNDSNCGAGPLPFDLTVVLQNPSASDGDWAPGTYSVQFQGWQPDVGQLAAGCVVDLPWAAGDLVSCTDNAELDVTETAIHQMVAHVGGPLSPQVTVIRDREVVGEYTGPIHRTPEAAMEACEAGPPDTITVELGEP